MAAKAKKPPKREAMVFYQCPYCGSMQLKSAVDIRFNDEWWCTVCHHRMKTA